MSAFFSDLRPPSKRFVSVFLALVVFVIGAFAVAYRIDQAPDIFTDEIIYTRISTRVAGERALVWDSGQPFIVHPPLFYLVAGTFLSITQRGPLPIYSAGDIFNLVFQVRFFNAIFAGLTALVLFWFGKRLQSLKLGLLLAGLFILDPFGVRINRRAMLETLALLLSLSGMAIFWVSSSTRRPDKRFLWLSPMVILAGLLMGFSLLVKEWMFINLVPIILYAVWDDGIYRYTHRVIHSNRRMQFQLQRHSTLMQALQITLIALLTYAIYLLWVSSAANSGFFFAEKWLGIQRLLGLVQLTGWNRPGISFTSILVQRLLDYGSSYLLIMLGGLSVFWLLLYGFVDRGARFLSSWGMVLYPFYFFVAIAGSGNDQFFYFLLIPAIILTGYAAITFPEAAHYVFSKALPKTLPGVNIIQSLSFNTWYLIGISILVILAAVFIPYNSTAWISNYIIASDNGYSQFSQYVQANLPAEERLNASGDPIKFRYFLPDQTITVAATPDEALQAGVRYYALAPKDVIMRYGRIKPELEDWITANGVLLFSTQGNSYGDIHLYQVDLPQLPTVLNDVQAQSGLKGADFQPANSAYIDSLIIYLLTWTFIWLGLAFAIYIFSNLGIHKRVRDNGQQADWI